MSVYKFLFTIVIVALLSTCAEKPTEVTTLGSIYGIVNDESNNNPLSGVTVSIPEIGNRVTSTNGAYEFDELEEDVYSVTASKAGYVSVTEQVEAISNKNKEVNFYLHVAQPAQLLVSPQSLNFGQTETELQLTIDNGGDDELSWQVSSDLSWLATFPTTGTTTSETDEITVSVNRSLLEVGNYTSSLSFTSNGGNVSVPVAMEVTPVGLILSENSLDFGEESTELFFTISNSGNGELNWSISANDSWITASPTSGTITTNTENITVNVNRSGLSPNTYTGSISVDSNGGNQSVSVTMVVPEGPSPAISVNPTTLDFGGSETQLTFTISNVGEETLNWSISADQSWISLWPSSGSTSTEEDEISVTVDRTGLSYSAYSGELNITSDGGDETISVNMDVPFFEDFADLNDWSNDGWSVSNSNLCYNPPCANCGDSQSTMSLDVSVIDGQVLSFWARINNVYNGEVALYLNNVQVWSRASEGTETPSLEISGTGVINIKFIGSHDSVYIDEIRIE